MSRALQTVGRSQVIAFRLDGHNLTRRLPSGSLAQAAAACGIRSAPPWAAPLSFLARVDGLTESELDRAVATDRTLVQSWSLRLAPYFVPAGDLAVFTRALLPTREEAARRLIPKLLPLLDAAGVSALEAMRLIAAAAAGALDGRTLGKSDLQDAVEERVGLDIWPWCDKCQLRHIADAQLHPAGWAGVCCFAPRAGNKPQFVRTDQWLGIPPLEASEAARAAARAELVRRYLRCYGPSDEAGFAEWAGIPPSEARHGFDLVRPELVEVAIAGRRAVLRQRDLPRLDTSLPAAGARLLPPGDPYLLLRDRETVVPGKALRARIWGASGAPGVVLVRGEAVATWRMQTRGKRLVVGIEPFAPLDARGRSDVEAEAARLATFRGCSVAETTFTL